MTRLLAALVVAALFVGSTATAEPQRWSPAQATAWYEAQPWLMGSNYVPANAVDELEMWQAATFDAKRIDLELSWAEKIGMNTMRVFLHDQLWQQDAKGFAERIDTFLAIASKHHIKPIFVLFDSCWDPNPKLGPQHPPIPGVHNSGWVQSPGTKALDDPADEPRLEAYVKGLVGKFAADERILAWDVWNEPDNEGGGNYMAAESKNKVQRVVDLLPKVFVWARSAKPKQPLTSGLWHDLDWNNPAALNAVEKTQIEQSDIISFHDYGWPESFAGRIAELKGYGRPIVCTEYMARGNGSTFDGDLPIAKRANVGMVNWGLVNGRTQTHLPWDSWQRPYVDMQPRIWFHDIFYENGRPYRLAEVSLLKAFSAAPKGVVPAEPKTFTNPLLASGPDPWIVQDGDTYYYTSTLDDRLQLWKTRDITRLAAAESRVVWRAPSSGPNSASVWSPELHRISGKWYLYYTASDKARDDDAHRHVFVLENPAADPLTGTWIDRGMLETEYSGIDGTVFEDGGKLWFVYSAYVGPDSHLILVEMKSPWETTSRQIHIATPTYDWEKHGGRQILEGPEFLKGPQGHRFITYSASGCWTDDYTLGLLTAAPGADLADARSWKKSPLPVFKKSEKNGVYGPGHNGFFKSPDGREDWIVHHANSAPGMKCTQARSPRIQKFSWTPEGLPNFGEPVSEHTALTAPSGTVSVDDVVRH